MIKGQSLYMQSILTAKQKENIRLRKELKAINETIERTKRYLKYLENMRVVTTNNLYNYSK